MFFVSRLVMLICACTCIIDVIPSPTYRTETLRHSQAPPRYDGHNITAQYGRLLIPRGSIVWAQGGTEKGTKNQDRLASPAKSQRGVR